MEQGYHFLRFSDTIIANLEYSMIAQGPER